MTNCRNHQSLDALNEMFMNALPSLTSEVENSVYYPKLKQLLHSEIITFCKEKIELKEDLNFLRLNVGQYLDENTIRDYLDGLKDKYDNKESNIGIEYHIENTRIDFGVPVFVIIRRGSEIFMKKFVFRFRKTSVSDSLEGLTGIGVPVPDRQKHLDKLFA